MKTAAVGGRRLVGGASAGKAYRGRLWIVVVGMAAIVGIACGSARAVTIDWVTVGNAGNANDTTGYGSVGYSYQIGKYDVTIGQYNDFLNAVASSDPYALYNPLMGSDGNWKGIQQSGSSGNYTYSVIGSPNRPIAQVNWFSAARFANWMTNGQGSGSTETGAYTLAGATSGNAVPANPGAAYRLPTENEWYKAAYYSPNHGGVGVPGYYTYATQSDTAPGNQIGGAANQANYRISAVYSVTQSSSYDSQQNYLTDVGAFTASASFYGTFDQNGNIYQWNDLDGTASADRGIRGGNWGSGSPFDLSSSQRYLVAPSNGANLGFRLASSGVPEIDPSGLRLAAALVLGSLALLERRRWGRGGL